MGNNAPSMNYTKTAVNLTEDSFDVKQDWHIDGIFWMPSVFLGLPTNILVIFLGNYANSLGNFRFAISSFSLLNALHCISRALLLMYYFFHYITAIPTTLVSCTLAANLLDKWFGYYIIFYIPFLAAYRYILLCTKRGELYLTKRNILIAIGVIASIPTISIAGRIFEMFTNMQIDGDNMCSYKYSDNGCVWCRSISTYGAYVSYAISFLFAVLLFVHLYRSFNKVGGIEGSRRGLRDEVGILACIIIETVLPIILTFPTKGGPLFRAIGIGRVGSTFASTVYNYNPLFDAILIIACVKPYRRAFLRIFHLDRTENMSGNIQGSRTRNVALRVVTVESPPRIFLSNEYGNHSLH